jgi:serine phosphatase RsbU (regulator of sigma subunit)
MRILFDTRQHLLLDPFSIGAGHRVIFAAPFGALRILSAGVDTDRYHRQEFVRADEIVQHVEELLRLEEAVRAAITAHDEGCSRTWDVVGRDVNIDLATPAVMTLSAESMMKVWTVP